MSQSLKGCKFEHTELSIHFESFNDVYAIVKEAQDAITIISLTFSGLDLIWVIRFQSP